MATENLEKCITKLAYSGCPWKPANLADVKVHTIYCGDSEIDSEDMGFHPNGCCGCLTLCDEEICGIRCDHLMWMVGDHEYFGDGKDGVLLLGNHKGTLFLKYLYEDVAE